MQTVTRLFSVITLLFVMLAGPSLFAKDGDRVQFGKSMQVEQDENAGDLVCVGCSIHMEGSCGDVVAIGGSITIDGDVKGDVADIGGAVRLGEKASVSGDVAAIGGKVWRHSDSVVKGSVSSQSGGLVLVGLIVVPLLPVILLVALVVWLVNRGRQQPPLLPARR